MGNLLRSRRTQFLATLSSLVLSALVMVSAPSHARQGQAQPAPDDLEATVKQMTRIGTCFSPALAPDGKRLAFVSDLNGVPQVWIVPAAGGWPTLVTGFDDPVGR